MKLISILFVLSIHSVFSKNLEEKLNPLKKKMIYALKSRDANGKYKKTCTSSYSVLLLDKKNNILDQAHFRENELNYLASIPKILILLGAMEKVSKGYLCLDDPLSDYLIGESQNQTVRHILESMIRKSSNLNASKSQQLLRGPKFGQVETGRIAEKYGFGKGKLWVGRGYGPGTYPGHKYNHEGTSKHIAKFYLKLAKEELPMSEEIYEIMAPTAFTKMRFIPALLDNGFELKNIFRKTGTYTGKSFEGDSFLAIKDDMKLIATLLTTGNGCNESWFSSLVNLALEDN
jgi:hypothetical protein